MRFTSPLGIDIDHVVAFAEAWGPGAYQWSPAVRESLANDFGFTRSLVAASAGSNRAKGDKEPHAWMPTLVSARCDYLTSWVSVKWRWRLAVDAPEKTHLTKALATCRWPAITASTRPVGPR